ncbi:hypothetical protein, partial [Neisseria meningitidis]|uniref:hypothetical protein n=1 Tax=Neisseria meningitidis TaxID=487 RepID=UPI001C8495EA
LSAASSPCPDLNLIHYTFIRANDWVLWAASCNIIPPCTAAWRYMNQLCLSCGAEARSCGGRGAN